METLFKPGDFVLDDGLNGVLEDGGYLPSKKISKDIFGEGPLEVCLTMDVECTCQSSNGKHSPDCPRARNRGHSQVLILIGPDHSQIQCSGAHKKIVFPPAA